MAHAVPSELVRSAGAQFRRGGDAPRQFGGRDAGFGPRQHKRHPAALPPEKVHRLAEASMHDWKAGEGRGGVGNAHDADEVVVHLERAIQFKRFARKEKMIAGQIDQHGIRLA